MRFTKFLFVGGFGFLIDLALFLLILHMTAMPILARAIASAGAITATWSVNRRVTFQWKRAASWSEYLKYSAVSLAGACANIAAFSLTLWCGGTLSFAYLAGACAGLAVNYHGYVRLVFTR